MEGNSRAVDIIIPVYNGYEDLQLCIASVKKHTDLTRHRVILINDCSPDERIRPYLDGLAGDGILVYHNEKNLGFSGNVNRGIAMAGKRDVILLNSDTIVTRNWVEKIVSCGYREEAIGTVTPLSNCATLCSVPVFCRDNQIPENFTPDSYGELIEKCSLRRYPKITVAVGFCMFIKRCVIEDIGYFDAETFGRGYGEENDFCNRAEQAGYCHVMCDDTFIYHKGTASFDTKEKQELQTAHEGILQERYPRQMERNRQYCRDNPDQEIRDNINMYTKLHNGRKNLLYLLHLDFRDRAKGNMGGTQSHVQELTEFFRKEFNVFVAARDGNYLQVTAYTEKDTVQLRFEIGAPPQFPVFRDGGLRYIYDQILRAFSIDLVHVHHTQDLSLEIYEAAKGLGIPVVATQHDYYSACPGILLLDENNHFCMTADDGLSEQERQERCGRCLHQRKNIASRTDYLGIWRREQEKALSICSRIVFPSEAARDILLHYYPVLAEKSLVIPHGEDYQEGDTDTVSVPAHVQRHPDLMVKMDPAVNRRQGLNGIKGWAYLAGVDNEQTRIYVEVTDREGVSECFAAVKAARPDVVDAVGNPDALMSGIDLRIRSEKLAEGPVKIRVLVEYAGAVYETGEVFHGEYRRRYGEKGRLNVAFLGGMVPQKGSGYAKAMIPLDTDQINWFVLGEIGDLDMLGIDQPNCFFSSKYKKEELSQLLQDNAIDVVCILPIWPETFCYTVSEAWMNGVPVLGTDMGAVGERIRESGGGWVVPADASAEDIYRKLLEIKAHPRELEEKKEIVRQIKRKSVAEMCGEYRRLYQSLPEAEISQNSREASAENRSGSRGVITAARDCDREFIFQGLALGEPSVGGQRGAALMNRMKNENAALRAYIDVLQGTTSYRFARKIADANIPFKEQLKRILKHRT